MADPDPLAEIKARRAPIGVLVLPRPQGPNDERVAEFIAHAPADIDHLVGEVERLREVETDWERVCEELRNAKVAIANLGDRLNLKIDEQRAADAKLLRLRELLVDLEWAGGAGYAPGPCCSACDAPQRDGHEPGCKLAEALGRV
jgi:hypothetical protein